jgi:ubiquinol-cytochrome c reductase cytochrome b subunit
LHAGLLPALLIGFLVLHIAVFRRHGLTAKEPLRRPDQAFWPDQILKDGIACLAVLATVLVLVFYLGADLGAPADPANSYSAARPEWYFLFLFQFLKFFPGEAEVIGAVVIPGVVMLLLFLMPFIGNWKIGHGFNVALLTGILIGAGVLTGLAITEDNRDLTYRNAVWEAHQFSKLAAQRAREGIPAVGAAVMLRHDPKAEALTVLTRQCFGCHAYTDASGHGSQPEKPTAPNLYNFGRKQWIADLLDKQKITSADYFGNVAFKEFSEEAGMIYFVHNDLESLGEGAAEKVAAALAAEGGFELDAKDKELVEAGQAILRDDSAGCAVCHPFHDAGSLGSAPDLTGYGTREWIMGMIADPGHERFYGHLENYEPGLQKMPAFQERLSEEVIGHVADWLRGDWEKPTPPPQDQPNGAETTER